jgi:hypothetical protein
VPSNHRLVLSMPTAALVDHVSFVKYLVPPTTHLDRHIASYVEVGGDMSGQRICHVGSRGGCRRKSSGTEHQQ